MEKRNLFYVVANRNFGYGSGYSDLYIVIFVPTSFRIENQGDSSIIWFDELANKYLEFHFAITPFFPTSVQKKKRSYSLINSQNALHILCCIQVQYRTT